MLILKLTHKHFTLLILTTLILCGLVSAQFDAKGETMKTPGPSTTGNLDTWVDEDGYYHYHPQRSLDTFIKYQQESPMALAQWLTNNAEEPSLDKDLMLKAAKFLKMQNIWGGGYGSDTKKAYPDINLAKLAFCISRQLHENEKFRSEYLKVDKGDLKDSDVKSMLSRACGYTYNFRKASSGYDLLKTWVDGTQSWSAKIKISENKANFDDFSYYFAQLFNQHKAGGAKPFDFWNLNKYVAATAVAHKDKDYIWFTMIAAQSKMKVTLSETKNTRGKYGINYRTIEDTALATKWYSKMFKHFDYVSSSMYRKLGDYGLETRKKQIARHDKFTIDQQEIYLANSRHHYPMFDPSLILQELNLMR